MCLGLWKREVLFRRNVEDGSTITYTVDPHLIIRDMHEAKLWYADPHFRLVVDGASIEGTFRSRTCPWTCQDEATGELDADQICRWCRSIDLRSHTRASRRTGGIRMP